MSLCFYEWRDATKCIFAGFCEYACTGDYQTPLVLEEFSMDLPGTSDLDIKQEDLKPIKEELKPQGSLKDIWSFGIQPEKKDDWDSAGKEGDWGLGVMSKNRKSKKVEEALTNAV